MVFEINVNTKKYSDMWCPIGRVNLQVVKNGIAEVTPATFNMSIVCNDGKLHLTSRCQGDACPFYKKPFLGVIGWGACTYGKSKTNWGMLIPWWIIAFTAVAAVYLKYFGGAVCN